MESVEDEWERELESQEDLDLLFATYNAQRVSVKEMRATLDKHGFNAVVKYSE